MTISFRVGYGSFKNTGKIIFIQMNFNIKKKKPLFQLRPGNNTRGAVPSAQESVRERDNEIDGSDAFSHASESRFANKNTVVLPELSYQQYLNSLLHRLDPRDQRIIVPFPYFKSEGFSLEAQKYELEKWLGDMYFCVVSGSFQLMLTKQLQYEQVKVFCSQNLLLNLLLFSERVSELEIDQTMSHINMKLNHSLEYLLSKYPQMKEVKPNKKLREAISSLNNMANDENDMLLSSKVQFKKKESEDYTSQIMQFLNYIVNLSTMKCELLGEETTYLKGFTDIMEKIFQWVELPEEILSEDSFYQYLTQTKQKPVEIKKADQSSQQDLNLGNINLNEEQEKDSPNQNSQILHQLSKQQPKTPSQVPDQMKKKEKNAKNPKLKRKMSSEYLEEKKQDLNEKQIKEYRERVKKYTNFKIGAKINPNTELYSSQEIQNADFKVKNTAILRVLTKWIEELEEKILQAKNLIVKRSFRFKTHSGEFFKLNAGEKNGLYQSAQKQIPIIKSLISTINEDCIKIEASLAKSTNRQKKTRNIPKYEYIVGRFCSKLESAASTYMVNYLNKIIHALLVIPHEADSTEEGNQTSKQGNRSKDVNLVTFKVSDLLRCKCSSHESEILRIFNMIKRISESDPEVFKIVRIKDRLEMGTRDILINLLFMKKIVCEVQLAVTDNMEEKQKMFDGFNHYLYELKRSYLGPIMESSCIWTHLDQRSRNFRALEDQKDSQLKTQSYRKHTCSKKELKPYQYAIVCSICGIFYSRPEGVLRNKKCFNCHKFYECNRCLEDQMSEAELKEYLGLLKGDMALFSKDFSFWRQSAQAQLPKFAIFISRKSPEIKYLFVEKVTLKETTFYVSTYEKSKRELGVKIIFTLKDQSKQVKKLLQEYFIFEWTEKRCFNTTLKAQVQKQRLRQRQEEEERERQKADEERKRKKEMVKERRKAEEKKWLGLAKVYEDSESQSDEGKEKDPNKEQIKHKKIDAETKHHVKNMMALVTSSNKEIQKVEQSRPSSRRSQSSRSSKALGNAKRQHKLNEGDQEINIEIIQKRSEEHPVRVAFSRVNKTLIYYLVLNIFMTEGQIKSYIKRELNEKIVTDMLEKKNEVIFLEDERIDIEFNLSPDIITKFKKSLSTITEIYMDENLIQNISFAQELPHLRVFHANHNYISDLTPLAKLKNLTEIVMANNQIYSLTPLNMMTKLKVLNFSKNNIQNILGLKNATMLVTLTLSYNSIMTIEGLENLKALVELNLSSNQIAKMVGLNTLSSLQKLDLRINGIQKMEGLDSNRSLRELYLGFNQIRVIEGLEGLPELQILMVNNNKIQKISGIANLSNLKTLSLSKNLLTGLEGLDKLSNLEDLDVSKNSISTIEYDSIEQLSNLQSFNLSGNNQTMIPKDILTFTPKLTKFNLTNNPIKKVKMENKKSADYISTHLKEFALMIK